MQKAAQRRLFKVVDIRLKRKVMGSFTTLGSFD